MLFLMSMLVLKKELKIAWSERIPRKQLFQILPKAFEWLPLRVTLFMACCNKFGRRTQCQGCCAFGNVLNIVPLNRPAITSSSP